MKSLYHGSYMSVPSPLTGVGRRELDFGPGFYVTSLREQAERWARRDRNLVPIVNYYEYEDAPGLANKTFLGMTDEWLDFIADCRGGKNHEWDIIEGPMANDTVWNYVNDFVSGAISREAFWALAKFKYPTHQICFHTPAALCSIKFLKAEELPR